MSIGLTDQESWILFSQSNPLMTIASPLAICIAALLTVGVSSSSSLAAESPPSGSLSAEAKERSRLEELFIWKTSEELKLPPAEEQTFTDAIHELNKRRREANAKMDSALLNLQNAKSKTEIDKALAAHRAALKEMQASQTAELDRLRPLLGPEKLAKYIVAKNSILEKLKSMLAAPSPAAPPSPTPVASPTVPTK